MKGRIIFVGIHNKPGMEPLDSRTKSGKIIDEVIKGLEGRECVKTNLFDVDEMPDKKNMLDWDKWVDEMVFDWVERTKLYMGDTVVLLGDEVKKYFTIGPLKRKITVPHPASRHIKPEQYIQSLIDKILEHE